MQISEDTLEVLDLALLDYSDRLDQLELPILRNHVWKLWLVALHRLLIWYELVLLLDCDLLLVLKVVGAVQVVLAEDGASLLCYLLLLKALAVEGLHHVLLLLDLALFEVRHSEFLLALVAVLVENVGLFLVIHVLERQLDLLFLLLLLLVIIWRPHRCDICTVQTVCGERVVVLVVVAAFDLDHAALISCLVRIVAVVLLIRLDLLRYDVV